MIDPVVFNTLRQFRAGIYQCFGSRRDALFDLLDASVVAGLVPSLAHLSLTPVHRRGWGSLYGALASGGLDAPALRELVGRYPLDDGQPIYALDSSVWPRDDAETSPARGFYFSPSRQSAGQPILRLRSGPPAGPMPGWPRSASPTTVGRRRWTCAASYQPTTCTLSPLRRSATWSSVGRSTAP